MVDLVFYYGFIANALSKIMVNFQKTTNNHELSTFDQAYGKCKCICTCNMN